MYSPLRFRMDIIGFATTANYQNVGNAAVRRDFWSIKDIMSKANLTPQYAENTIVTVSHDGDCIMLWGCFGQRCPFARHIKLMETNLKKPAAVGCIDMHMEV